MQLVQDVHIVFHTSIFNYECSSAHCICYTTSLLIYHIKPICSYLNHIKDRFIFYILHNSIDYTKHSSNSRKSSKSILQIHKGKKSCFIFMFLWEKRRDCSYMILGLLQMSCLPSCGTLHCLAILQLIPW